MTRGKYAWRIIGFIFKGLCTAVIVGVFGLLLWRIIDSKIDPKEIKGVTPNDALCSAYEEYGGKLTVFNQEQQTFTRAEHNEGYFAVTVENSGNCIGCGSCFYQCPEPGAITIYEEVE